MNKVNKPKHVKRYRKRIKEQNRHNVNEELDWDDPDPDHTEKSDVFWFRFQQQVYDPEQSVTPHSRCWHTGMATSRALGNRYLSCSCSAARCCVLPAAPWACHIPPQQIQTCPSPESDLLNQTTRCSNMRSQRLIILTDSKLTLNLQLCDLLYLQREWRQNTSIIQQASFSSRCRGPGGWMDNSRKTQWGVMCDEGTASGLSGARDPPTPTVMTAVSQTREQGEGAFLRVYLLTSWPFSPAPN